MRALADPEGVIVVPDEPSGRGALVLAGSRGRADEQRARVLAGAGVTALAVQWFGRSGQQPGPHDVPLEQFSAALDRLARHCDRLSVLGMSFGAEAALLTAAYDDRVTGCVALAPSSVVWAGVEASGRVTSHWTRGGDPLPFVPFVDDWEPDTDPPAYCSLYEQSLAADPAVTERATIPVEQIGGEPVLVAGGDDRLWPSVWFAQRIAARRSAYGLATTVVTHPSAGHRTVLPGENPVSGGQRMARGGTPRADAELGERAWPAVLTALS